MTASPATGNTQSCKGILTLNYPCKYLIKLIIFKNKSMPLKFLGNNYCNEVLEIQSKIITKLHIY